MNERGFMLVEVSITYVILALAIAALVPTFILALKANKQTEKIQTAGILSGGLMEEVTLHKWDETTSSTTYTSTPSTVLGRETGETAGVKTLFDDIDDFNGYSENGVQDPMGGPVVGLGGYSRAVTVEYVDANLAVVGTTTDRKKITVCTKSTNLRDVCVYTVMANR